MMREHGMCQQAEMYYFACLEKDYGQVPEEVLQHLNTCEYCQKQMALLCTELKRAPEDCDQLMICRLHQELLGQWVCCEQVRPFLPILAMKHQGLSMATPVTVHIDRCPDCAKDYQTILGLELSVNQFQDAACFLSGRQVDAVDDNPDFKSVLQQIADRPGSSVVTRMSIDANVEIDADDEVPMIIEQAERIERPVEVTSSGATVKPQRRQHYVGRLASMAAVLVLAAYLLMHPATVRGFGITDVYHAMSEVVNVCIKTIVAENDVPLQTIWISKSQNKMLLENPGRTVLWDMNTQSRQVNGVLQQGTIEVSPEIFDVPWGLLPFRQISELPPSYTWTLVDSIHEYNGKPVLVYDYAWQDTSAGLSVQRKWRGYLDPESKLPQKIEWWEKVPTDETFKVVTTQLIEYPTNRQVELRIQQAGN